MLAKQESVWVKYLVVGGVIVLLLLWLAGRTFGQTTAEIKQNTADKPAASLTQAATATPGPVFTNYKGVTIGASADEVRRMFDAKPKNDDGNTLLFEFADGEMVQIGLDEEKKVRLIAATFLGKEAHAPTFESVFGASVPVSEMPDGRIYKMVRYPDAGYWVTYSSLAPGKDEQMVAITIQKLNN